MHSQYPPTETSRHERAFDHYAELTAAASVPRLLALLSEAVAALGPEYPDLAERIRSVLFTDDRPMLGMPPTRDEPALGCLPEYDLVLEQLPNGEHAWLRPRPLDPDAPIPYTITSLAGWRFHDDGVHH